MKIRILFVCLGNICRSQCAKAVMNKIVSENRLSSYIECDSAGIIAIHQGEPADPRMKIHAARRGYLLNGTSRPINPQSDFDHFDYIIGMDNQNIIDLQQLSRNNTDRKKIYKMADFLSDNHCQSVPDPYYGGSKGFELVIDLLEDGCTNLLKHLYKKTKKLSSIV